MLSTNLLQIFLPSFELSMTHHAITSNSDYRSTTICFGSHFLANCFLCHVSLFLITLVKFLVSDQTSADSMTIKTQTVFHSGFTPFFEQIAADRQLKKNPKSLIHFGCHFLANYFLCHLSLFFYYTYKLLKVKTLHQSYFKTLKKKNSKKENLILENYH